MAHFVGLDVSVKETSVCVVDDAGKVVLEQKVPTEPDAIIALLTSLGVTYSRIGIEAGPLSQWCHDDSLGCPIARQLHGVEAGRLGRRLVQLNPWRWGSARRRGGLGLGRRFARRPPLHQRLGRGSRRRLDARNGEGYIGRGPRRQAGDQSHRTRRGRRPRQDCPAARRRG